MSFLTESFAAAKTSFSLVEENLNVFKRGMSMADRNLTVENKVNSEKTLTKALWGLKAASEKLSKLDTE